VTRRCACISLLLIAGCTHHRPPAQPPAPPPSPPPAASTASWPGEGEPFPPFTLPTTTGGIVSERDFLGHETVVTFVFTSCRVACPRTMRELLFLDKELAATGLRLLAITIDPDHDTPEMFTAYAREAGMGPALDAGRLTLARGGKQETWSLVRTALRGEIEESDRIKYVLDDGTEIMHIFHPARFVLVDGNGVVVRSVDSGSRTQVKELSAIVRARAAATGND
jgi:protein SCO1/2